MKTVSDRFKILELSVARDAAGEPTAVTISWDSEAEETYTVERSIGLGGNGDFWQEITDGVEATGNKTAFTDSVLPDPLPDALYCRVKKE